MPFDPENPFAPADPSQLLATRTPLRITVRPKPPPSDGVDDWFVPASDGYPDDWLVPTPSAAPSAGQFPPGAQPNTNFGGAYPAATPDPFAAYWSRIPASRVGAMAWDPPNLPLFGPLPDSNFSAPPTPSYVPQIPLGSRPSTLGLDIPRWSSTQSLPSPAIPQGGLFDKLATLEPPPPPWAIPKGGMFDGLAKLGAPPPTPAIPEGGILGALANLGTPSPSTSTFSLAGGSFPAAVPSAFSQPSPSSLVVPVNGQATTRPGWIPLGPGSGWEPWADQFIRGMQGLINHFRSRQSVGDPDAPDCKEEWDDARRQCAKWLAQPNPPRGLTGGHRNVEDCARGHVSERCGGNPFDR